MFLQKLSKNLQILYNLKTVTKSSQNYSRKYPLTLVYPQIFIENKFTVPLPENIQKLLKIKQDRKDFQSKRLLKVKSNIKTLLFTLDS